MQSEKRTQCKKYPGKNMFGFFLSELQQNQHNSMKYFNLAKMSFRKKNLQNYVKVVLNTYI